MATQKAGLIASFVNLAVLTTFEFIIIFGGRMDFGALPYIHHLNHPLTSVDRERDLTSNSYLLHIESLSIDRNMLVYFFHIVLAYMQSNFHQFFCF